MLSPMRPAQRYEALQAIAGFLISQTEADRSLLLRTAGSPDGFRRASGSWTRASNRTDLLLVLSSQGDQVLEALMEMLPEDQQRPKTERTTAAAIPDNAPAPAVAGTNEGPIFVVHGHTRATLYEAVRVLERGTGRKVIVLHEQPNAGLTILEKFENYAGEVSFAVVL